MFDSANLNSKTKLLTILFLIAVGGLENSWSQFHNLRKVGGPDFRFQLRSSSTRNNPNRNLDTAVKFEAGSLSLVYDIEKARDNHLDVYLVNDTTEDFRFDRLTLELPIVLEADLGNGIWERAETRNDQSNYKLRGGKETISAGHHKKRECRHWEAGETANLRYALYDQGKAIVVSKTFTGKLPAGKIHEARRDLMSAVQVPEVLQIRYIPEKTTFSEIKQQWPNKLTLLKHLGPCYIDLEEAQKWTSEVHNSPVSTREERDVAVRLQMTMLQKWAANFDLSRLLNFCSQQVSDADLSKTHLRALCWQVMQNSFESNNSSDNYTIAKAAWKVLGLNASEVEKQAATRYLCSDSIVRSHSPILNSSNPEQLLESENSFYRIVAANY